MWELETIKRDINLQGLTTETLEKHYSARLLISYWNKQIMQSIKAHNEKNASPKEPTRQELLNKIDQLEFKIKELTYQP